MKKPVCMGRSALKQGTVEGEILLNLDSEEEGELYIGCAGGEDPDRNFGIQGRRNRSGRRGAEGDTGGLRGGPLVFQIGWGHANANKLMARFMNQVIAYDEAWSGVMGRWKHATPFRVNEVVITVPASEVEDVLAFVGECEQVWRDEFATIEDNISFTAERVDLPKMMVPERNP